MSLDGRNALRGDTFSLYRPTETDAGGGETTRTWATIASGQRAVFETLSHELAQQLYGVATETTVRCKVPLAFDARTGDGVAIVTGPYASQRFLVHAAPPRVSHREVVLLVTTQPFP